MPVAARASAHDPNSPVISRGWTMTRMFSVSLPINHVSVPILCSPTIQAICASDWGTFDDARGDAVVERPVERHNPHQTVPSPCLWVSQNATSSVTWKPDALVALNSLVTRMTVASRPQVSHEIFMSGLPSRCISIVTWIYGRTGPLSRVGQPWPYWSSGRSQTPCRASLNSSHRAVMSLSPVVVVWLVPCSLIIPWPLGRCVTAGVLASVSVMTGTGTGSLGPGASPWRGGPTRAWLRQARRRWWDQHCWPGVRPHLYQFVQPGQQQSDLVVPTGDAGDAAAAGEGVGRVGVGDQPIELKCTRCERVLPLVGSVST